MENNEMNEIKKCPFCRGDAELTIEVETDCVNATIGCSYCDIIFRFIVPLSEYKTINEAVDDVLTMALERWNTEPQEKKETRFERLLKEEQQADKLVCCLAYRDKHKGKSCVTEICSECEFRDKKHAINYLLAPHED